MATLLHIIASPRKQRSKSNQIADKFIDEYKKKNPSDTIEALNIFEAGLPTFDGDTINAKYNIMHNQAHSEDEKKAWSTVEKIIDNFKSADKYLFSIPMWNFGIPYKLKQYIDIIVQPTYTFTFDQEKGYTGLVTGKPAMLIFARGGDYSDAELEKQVDHQKSYMQLLLGFIGFTDIQSITAQPMLAQGPDKAQEQLDIAIKQAQISAQVF